MTTKARARPKRTVSTYALDGLFCGVCLATVMEAVRGLPHVTGVAVNLVIDGRSGLLVSSDEALVEQGVIDRVERVGFHAFPASRGHARRLQRTFTGRLPDLHSSAET